MITDRIQHGLQFFNVRKRSTSKPNIFVLIEESICIWWKRENNVLLTMFAPEFLLGLESRYRFLSLLDNSSFSEIEDSRKVTSVILTMILDMFLYTMPVSSKILDLSEINKSF